MISAFTVPIAVFDRKPCMFWETLSPSDGLTRIKYKSKIIRICGDLFVRFDLVRD